VRKKKVRGGARKKNRRPVMRHPGVTEPDLAKNAFYKFGVFVGCVHGTRCLTAYYNPQDPKDPRQRNKDTLHKSVKKVCSREKGLASEKCSGLGERQVTLRGWGGY